MKKNIRHEKILAIIAQYDISTQEQLMQKLTDSGFDVTQATVSRDIKALNLVKIQGVNGQYKYAAVKNDGSESEKFDSILLHSVISVDHAGNITVIHCHAGMANAACASIDALHFEDAVGSIAGDDTIFILNRTEKAAFELQERINRILQK